MRNRHGKRFLQALLLAAGVAVVAVAVARLPAPGREGGSWDVVDAHGQVIGSAAMYCDGSIVEWGSQNGRFANIVIYRC